MNEKLVPPPLKKIWKKRVSFFWIVVKFFFKTKILGINNGTMLGEGTFHPIKNPSETTEELPSFCFLTIFFLLLYFLSVRTFQLSQSTVLYKLKKKFSTVSSCSSWLSVRSLRLSWENLGAWQHRDKWALVWLINV